VSTIDNYAEQVGGIQSTRWNKGLIPSGEGLGLLDLVKYITAQTKQLEDGEICIYNDNKKLLREIERDIKKGSECTQETGAVVAGIRREVKNTYVLIKFEYSNDKRIPNRSFQQQPGVFLMKYFDKESKKQCVLLKDQDVENKI